MKRSDDRSTPADGCPDSLGDQGRVDGSDAPLPGPEGRTLYLPVKRRWFEEIKAGTKTEEYRLANTFWATRLVGKQFAKIVITLGYPRRDDTARRMEFPWRGFYRRVITSEEWANVPKEVYAIRLEPRRAEGGTTGASPGNAPAQAAGKPEPNQ